MQIFEKHDKMHVHFETFIYHKSLPKICKAMRSLWLTKINLQNVVLLKIKSGEAPTCYTFCAFIEQNSRPAATDPYIVSNEPH
jgi:hypothetical protein